MGLTSLMSALSPSVEESRGDVVLTALSKFDGSPQESFVFQHFPEQISDSKAIGWQTKEIPGGSLPLYQWTTSGERVVSFKVVFASDVDFLVGGDSRAEELLDRVKQAGLERFNVDIRSALAHLRKFVLPTYGDDQGLGVPVTLAPQRLRLFVPGSGIGIIGGVGGGDYPVTPDSIICVMTQCDFDFLEFFPSGLPRIVEAQLSFAQVPQIGAGNIVFPQAPLNGEDIAGAGGPNADAWRTKAAFLPYTLSPRSRGGDH